MKALIVGANGQIGRALVAVAPAEVRVSARDRAGLDLTRPDQVRRLLREEAPDVALNAAGYTAVDRAESEPEAARAVNEQGARHVAEAAAEVGARLLHFSTDYVFDGGLRRPYRAADPPHPLNVYGATKLAGERAVLETLGDRAAVLRTAWVYAPRGRNFLLTMLRLLGEQERVRVVSDQIGAPTSAASAARAAWAMAVRDDLHGILHWTDDGVASWFELALAIREEALRIGLLGEAAPVVPVATEDYPTPACRPRYSVLDCSDAREALGLVPDHWRVELGRTLRVVADG